MASSGRAAGAALAAASAALALAGCSAFAAGTQHRATAVRSTPSRAPAAGPVSFVAQARGAADTNVAEVSRLGGRPRPVTRGGPPVVDAAWSADGRELVFARRFEDPAAGNAAGHVDVFVLRRGGRPVLIRRCPLSCDARSFAWSPDGRRIAFVTNIRSRFTGTAGEIAVMNADGSGFHAVCAETVCGQGLDDPQWSPDGSKLLFSNMGVINFIGPGIPPSRVWIATPERAGAHPLTQPRCHPGHPPLVGCAYDSAASWSPDGRWIAFSRLYERFGPPPHTKPRTVIELMHPDGSDLHPLATCRGDLCNQIMPPVWSPDGTRLAYAPMVERASRIVLLAPSGHRTTINVCAARRCITPYDLAWAPTGGALALLDQTTRPTAYVISAAGGDMHPVGHDVQCCLTWLPAR